MNFWDIVLIPIALFVGVVVVGIIFWGGAFVVALIVDWAKVRKHGREKAKNRVISGARVVPGGKIAWA